MRENIFHFGKHKGKPLNEVPEDYLEWVLLHSIDKRAVIAAEQELYRRGTEMISKQASQT